MSYVTAKTWLKNNDLRQKTKFQKKKNLIKHIEKNEGEINVYKFWGNV